MPSDPFSDFLGLMEARSVRWRGFAAAGRWPLHFPPPDEDASIFEIAESLGYRAESALSQPFKRVTGSRPRDYRNAMKT